MYTITPKGIGKKVGFRSVRADWKLTEGELFKVETLPDNPVLAEDGVSLREATAEELKEPLYYTAQQIREMFTDDEMKAVMAKAKEDINVELILMKLNTRLTPIVKDDDSLVAAVTYLQSLNLAPQNLIDSVLS